MVSPFEKTVAHAMHPALEQILQAAGFAARITPEDLTDGLRVVLSTYPAG
jgi:hypothetical protein